MRRLLGLALGLRILPKNTSILAALEHSVLGILLFDNGGLKVAQLNRRSSVITTGDACAPRRAMLRAVGFKDGDFKKPIVGVAHGHSTMNPCNAGIQPLADRAVEALKAAGA